MKVIEAFSSTSPLQIITASGRGQRHPRRATPAGGQTNGQMGMPWAPAAGGSSSSLGLRQSGRPRHLVGPGILQVDRPAGHLGCCSLVWRGLAGHGLTTDRGMGLLAGDLRATE